MKLFKKHTIYFRIVVYKAAASSAMYSRTYQLNQIAVAIYYYFQYRNVQNYIKRLESFSDAYITYRILLTIHFTVIFIKRSFSKLKLINSYLRLIMSQEKLNGLAILSIEK